MVREINEGDKAVVLYCQFLVPGTVLKVNKKTFKVHVPKMGFNLSFTKNISKERVMHIDDEFTVVWDTKRGVEGSYRIDATTYPEENKPYTHWYQPFTYIVER